MPNPALNGEKNNLLLHTSVPSIEKLNELLNAVCPQSDIVINESTIPLTNA
ncbi:Uncharacterized protein dnm_010590 [Desulfonema magnum]|uniref:Uncharacterized protein n=1 Tax=Desulfonema magnum TaxID=45655 RepID=A0A975BGV9_9BACT|nr:Uncharacterized protein dnm_010590 [Desulfonema magnum]